MCPSCLFGLTLNRQITVASPLTASKLLDRAETPAKDKQKEKTHKEEVMDPEVERQATERAQEFLKARTKEVERMAQFQSLVQKRRAQQTAKTEHQAPNHKNKDTTDSSKPKFSMPSVGPRKSGESLAARGIPPLKASNSGSDVVSKQSMSQFLEGIRTVKPTLSMAKPKSHLGGTSPVCFY